jgi:hypothetical protein
LKKTHTTAIAFFFLLFSVVIFTAGCKKESKKKLTPVCDGTAATYNSTVKAIINGNCLGCHSGFSTYNGLSSVTANGQFKQHILIDQDMPKDGSLTQDQLNKIQCWVEAGYPEN